MLDKYHVEHTLLRDMLGTNPCDPNVHDTFILERQRKLIVEKGGINAKINKYLDQIQISAEKGDAEVQKLLDKLEELTGYELSKDEREDAIAGKLESLKETLQQLDVKGTTVFFWDKATDRPCIGDHMVYGFLKASCEALGKALLPGDRKQGTMIGSTAWSQSIINLHVRCREQFIVFDRDIKRDKDGNAFYLQRSLRAKTAQGPRISLAKSEVVEAGAKFSYQLNVMKNSPCTLDILKQLYQYGEDFCGFGQWRNSGHGMFETSIKLIS